MITLLEAEKKVKIKMITNIRTHNDEGLLNVIVDISAWQKGLVETELVEHIHTNCIIAKATQGSSMVDSCFKNFNADSLKNGLMRGAYHFGTNYDGASQARFYLQTINYQTDKEILMVLDWENYQNKNMQNLTMSKQQAIAFVQTIFQMTGKYPVLYTGTFFLDAQRLTDTEKLILNNCPLWIARYMDSPPPTVKGFSPWRMWQWTGSELAITNPKHQKNPLDRSVFNGTWDELVTFWTEHQT